MKQTVLAGLGMLAIFMPVTAGVNDGIEVAPRGPVFGQFYPHRNDDLAWENDLVGFRAYGPRTQANGERAYGYDLFLKPQTSTPVLPLLYAIEQNPRTWQVERAVRAVNPGLADQFVKSFSYHVDHGFGFDPYPVGQSLGAGVLALLDSEGKIIFPWCYDHAEIIENGPDRFTAHLVYKPTDVDGNPGLVEHRIISLANGTHLNDTKVWYENQKTPLGYVVGVPRRDESKAMCGNGIIAYGDPTDKQPGHTAYIGVVVPKGVTEYGERQGHITAKGTVNPGDTISYSWGFTWPGSDITDMTSWVEYLYDER